MPEHYVKLNRRQEVATGTFAFYFDKPEGFSFEAGQFLEWALVDPPETDEDGNKRAFTIASAPSEPYLMVATRMRDSAFKRVLKGMPLGTEVRVEGPFGNLILHDDTTRPAVFLAGGIGITPFRSIAVRAAREGLPHRLILFYSNRRPEDAPFLQELRDLRTENAHYTLVDTMTAGGDAGSVESGRISKEMLARHIGDLNGPIYYVAGPPDMVAAMQRILYSAGLKNDAIRAEEFSGY